MSSSRVKILKQSDKSIEIELEGEDHTMANLIAKYAIKKPHVVYASYIVSHPLVGNPVIVVTTDGSRNPLDVVEDVLRDIISDARDFAERLEKAFSEGLKCEKRDTSSSSA